MAKVIVSETYLSDIADAIRAKNGSSNTYTPAQMATAISNISGGGGSTTPTLQTKSVSITPSETAQSQTVTADPGYDGLDEVSVSVGAISSSYVGSEVTQRTSTDLSVSGATVTAPAGYYASSASIVVPNTFVTGTFTTGSSAGTGSVSIPYSGTGYPIMAIVVIDNGAYNSAVSGWYDSTQRYAVGQWTMTKSVFTSTPTYSTSGAANQGVTTAIYKNSASSSTSYTRTSGMNTNIFSSSNAANAALTCVRFTGHKTLSYYVNTSSYGLLPNTTYRYYINYSA